MNNLKPNCFECKNATAISNGFAGNRYEPPEPPSVDDCRFELPDELFDFNEEQRAEKCGHFDPVLIDKCSECGKVINSPQYNWDYWVTFYDRKPVCSVKCQQIGQDKVNKEIGELTSPNF